MWIDYANVLAMFCVVWFHVPSMIEAPIRQTEFIIVNVVFFTLSGISSYFYLQKDTTVLRFLKSNAISLGKPTLIFFVFFYILWLLIGKELGGDSEAWYIPLKEIICGVPKTVLATFWFIVCLFVLRLLFFLALKFIKNKTIVYLLSGLCPFFVLLQFPNYYEANLAMLFIPFFAMGHAYMQVESTKVTPLIILLPAIGLFSYILLGESGIISAPYYDMSEVVVAILFTAIVIMASRMISTFSPCKPMVSILRYGALVLLAIQNYIISLTKVMLDKVFHSTDFLANHFALKVVVVFEVYAIGMIVIFLIRKYAPFVLKK